MKTQPPHEEIVSTFVRYIVAKLEPSSGGLLWTTHRHPYIKAELKFKYKG